MACHHPSPLPNGRGRSDRRTPPIQELSSILPVIPERGSRADFPRIGIVMAAVADAHADGARGGIASRALVVGALGVVFGDIGTSPLYALREAAVAADH